MKTNQKIITKDNTEYTIQLFKKNLPRLNVTREFIVIDNINKIHLFKHGIIRTNTAGYKYVVVDRFQNEEDGYICEFINKISMSYCITRCYEIINQKEITQIIN